jgi:hypothetical protein
LGHCRNLPDCVVLQTKIVRDNLQALSLQWTNLIGGFINYRSVNNSDESSSISFHWLASSLKGLPVRQPPPG